MIYCLLLLVIRNFEEKEERKQYILVHETFAKAKLKLFGN